MHVQEKPVLSSLSMTGPHPAKGEPLGAQIKGVHHISLQSHTFTGGL